MENVLVDSSPITQDALSYLRDKNTDIVKFRHFADKISQQLLVKALKETDYVATPIETPISPTTTNFLHGNFVFVTILRAGLAMMPAALQLIPTMPVGFLGLKRDEQTAIAYEYYTNLPKITSDSIVIIADPMLATGGSMIKTLEKISSFNPKEIRIVTVICAPEGIEKVHAQFPNIQIITAAIDKMLNDKKYIIPGLGDFGDRYFGTEG